MSDGAFFLMAVGALLIAVGAAGIVRKSPLKSWQPGDRISLIETAASVFDRNFVPSGEMRWERRIYQLICWFGLSAGVALVAIGLWYSQNS